MDSKEGQDDLAALISESGGKPDESDIKNFLQK
jgi:hypothetical protein